MQPLHDIESDNDEYDDDEQSLDNEGEITAQHNNSNQPLHDIDSNNEEYDDDEESLDNEDDIYDNENNDNSRPMDVDIDIRQCVTNIADSVDNNIEHIHQVQNLGGLPADGDYNNGLGLEGFSTATSVKD